MALSLTLGLLLGLGGCSPDAEMAPDVMERSAFVDVYVALRMAALGTSDANLPEAVRDSILSEYGVSADDLVGFAEVHGRNPDYMLEVWRDVESRLNIPVDSTAEDSN